jgi:prepilin peptidase CpaA
MGPFADSPLGLVAGLSFTAILLLAALGDLRTRRIPNRLVALLAVLGLVYSISAQPFLPGALRGSAGILIGLVCWLPFYAFGWLGAGDVKLFAAAGAWLGPIGAVEGALVGACAGAVLALVWMVRSRGVRRTAETLGMAAGSPALLSPGETDSRRSKLPYGIAIAFGALWAGWMPRMLFA